MASANYSPCAACKFMRRKCVEDCFFAPYFPPEYPQRFSCLSRVFGKSNVERLLRDLPESDRQAAVESLVYDAEARLRDPVYGCVGLLSVMQKKLRQIKAQVNDAKKDLRQYVSPQEVEYLLANPGAVILPTQPGFAAGDMVPPVVIPMEQQLLEAQQLADARQVISERRRGQEANKGRPVRGVVIRDPQEAQQPELLEATQLAAKMADIGLHSRGAVIMAEQGGEQVAILDPQEREFVEAQLMKQAMEESRQLHLQQEAMFWNDTRHHQWESVGAGSSGGGGLDQQVGIVVHGGGSGGFHRGEGSSSQFQFDNAGSYQMQQQPQQGGEYHHQDHQVPHYLPVEDIYQMLQQPQQGGEYHHHQDHLDPHYPLVEEQQGSYQMQQQPQQGSNQMQQQPQQGEEYHPVPLHSPVESQQDSNQMQQDPQQGGEYHHDGFSQQKQQQLQQQKLDLEAGRSIGPCC